MRSAIAGSPDIFFEAPLGYASARMLRRYLCRRLLALGACLASSAFASCSTSDVSAPSADAPPVDLDAPSLGTAAAESVACPMDAPAAAHCQSVVISCPRLEDLGVIVAATDPAGVSPDATVVLHDFLGGTAFLDDGFVDAYRAAGLRVVQAKWASDWQQSLVGLKHAACRYATLLQWIFDNVHSEGRARGFCAQSLGGGSGGLAFALAHYGMGSVLDAVTISAGPPFARLDLGCDPSSAPRVACPGSAPTAVSYGGGMLDVIAKWESATTCGHGGASSVETARWAADSILSPGAVLAFPRTSLAAFYCTNSPDATVGQGSLFFDQVTSDRTVHCVSGGDAGGACDGEKPWPSALPDIVADLRTRCVPRHGP